MQKYRDENEYVYIGGATFLLILIAYIGKNLSNVLLFWVSLRTGQTAFKSQKYLWFLKSHFKACTMGAIVGLAYRLDQKLYKIDYNKSKQK